MCTVSYIPVDGRIHLTSNRDEKRVRQPAIPPQLYSTDGFSLIFPKDKERGGTWMAADKKGNAAVLLNGATQPHLPNARHTSSRGFVIPQLLASSNALDTWHQLDLQHTEPFTLILYFGRRLYECRWDDQHKTIKELPAKEKHIWSSATLYTPEVMLKRKHWFEQWLQQTPRPEREAIVSFHQFTGDGDRYNDLVMNRDGVTSTVSITSICLEKGGGSMEYLDLVEEKKYRPVLRFHSDAYTNIQEQCQRIGVRLFHWEYWPFHVVYAPVYVYYTYLSLKARSFFFFNAANPTIRNGGFLMESKKEIYDLLPEGTYPATILVQRNDADLATIEKALAAQHMQFPLIAKPDIGLRGLGVKKLHDSEELMAYHEVSKVDYLLQAFVPYTKEVGVFYYRLPGEPRGKISGMVGKELLRIRGDGKHTLEELLQRESRFFLQLPALRHMEGLDLSEILPAGEDKLIVPYGNHSRGAKFLDISDQLTGPLADMLEAICKSVPGFYFGRLDIKYDSWEALCRGENFSIIELNGAGSEPAHIYDPKHSIWFAWKEIMRHLNILYRISKQNKARGQQSYLSMQEGLRLLRANSAYMRKLT